MQYARVIFASKPTLGLVLLSAALSLPWVSHAELPAEPIPNVLTLETPYPPTYAMVHDFAFSGLIDSKFGLVDTANNRFKGMLSAGQFATINHSVARQKFYVGETVHTRGARGQRQDVLAIYDFANLSLVGEIDLPPKRMNVVVNKGSTGITDNDKFFLQFNMNPATSATIIDLDKEAIVNEIQLPGCSLVYPDAKGGFITLCGNGGLLQVGLDADGMESERWASPVFNDIDNDPLSEKAERIGSTWYFVTYGGEVQPIDTAGAQAQMLPRWSVATDEEQAAGWRPAGWHGKAAHPDGLLWVAMTPNGYNGSHKDPATHVWLFDAQTGERKAQFELKTMALSITVSKGGKNARPQLLAVNIEAGLDVYDAMSGEYQSTIVQMGDTPYIVHAVD